MKNITKILAASMLFSPFALNAYWNGTSGVSGDWLTGTNWTEGTAPNASGAIAQFGSGDTALAGGSFIIALDSDVQIQTWNMQPRNASANLDVTLNNAVGKDYKITIQDFAGKNATNSNASNFVTFNTRVDFVANATMSSRAYNLNFNNSVNYLGDATIGVASSATKSYSTIYNGAVNLNGTLTIGTNNGVVSFKKTGATGSAASNVVFTGAGYNTSSANALDSAIMTLEAKNSLATNSISTAFSGVADWNKFVVWGASDALVSDTMRTKLVFGSLGGNAGTSYMNLFMNGYNQTFGQLDFQKGAAKTAGLSFKLDMGGNGTVVNPDLGVTTGSGHASALIFADSSALSDNWDTIGYSLKFVNFDDNSVVAFEDAGLTDAQKLHLGFFSDVDGNTAVAGFDWATTNIGGKDYLYYGNLDSLRAYVPETSEMALLAGVIALGFVAYRRRK